MGGGGQGEGKGSGGMMAAGGGAEMLAFDCAPVVVTGWCG